MLNFIGQKENSVQIVLEMVKKLLCLKKSLAINTFTNKIRPLKAIKNSKRQKLPSPKKHASSLNKIMFRSISAKMISNKNK